jgi:hypothetical protein
VTEYSTPANWKNSSQTSTRCVDRMSPEVRRIILDTDVASFSIKKQLPPTLLSKLVGAHIGITFVTMGELTRWAAERHVGCGLLPHL